MWLSSKHQIYLLLFVALIVLMHLLFGDRATGPSGSTMGGRIMVAQHHIASPIPKKKGAQPGTTHTLTLFYADWCSHCQTMKPSWLSIKEALGEGHVSAEQVDCTDLPDAATPMNKPVRGFPTLVLTTYRSGKAVKEDEYDGPRDAKSVLRWVDTAAKAAKAAK